MTMEDAVKLAQTRANTQRFPAYVLKLVNGSYAVVGTRAIEFEGEWAQPQPKSHIQEIAVTVQPRPLTDEEWYGR